jgi:hypothetical protein
MKSISDGILAFALIGIPGTKKKNYSAMISSADAWSPENLGITAYG